MLELIQNGGVTSPKGYIAGAISAGLKSEIGALDLAILYSEDEASLASVFTTNKIESPSVTLSRKRSVSLKSHGVVVNSGCANCAVGSQGFSDAEEMTSLAANMFNINPEKILICSTGKIGVELPMALIRQNINKIVLTESGGEDFSKAIMTTDNYNKQFAVAIEIDEVKVTIGGSAKGSGMIHPNMATMLGFITTDANIEPEFFQESLKKAVDISFNMIDVDGDQSTNDSVLAFANGRSKNINIDRSSVYAEQFQEALNYVCIELAKSLVIDGEGAQTLIEVEVQGAKSFEDAAKASRGISSSNLVKSMVHGKDPNWGRIMMALGKTGAEMIEDKIDIFINDIHIVHQGKAIPYFNEAVLGAMKTDKVVFTISLNIGDFKATAWGCDLTEEYVIFNSAYTT
ncbi:MAG: bifunctional ornithine acetyltransferase/N-acetylglutamate synthase [Chloroflexi bacterium]|jgi:glutamate N-acetyltransferase/amino-acid N-acetyltransferase|nr:bifunctional ornithine acetyltransferase/N-acetylglutamate synthase [Chloroflexota bacterium]MCH2304957.1 bifunctional glutamate N-acetyltransferase/amino-acid acetyltransferase ArgJ [SAR202 cluster bacterium]|tara:strand:- start:16202 stop:17407 length:1206 start_codon:yes stop_codon:yes gene_type:complete